jgi:diguanylate cyclase (GGDEF)-like protein
MLNNSKGNILIVDDTPNNLKFLSTTLSDQGFKVRSVVNGTMALTVAQAAQPDLILLDIKMPEMDGYETCQHLKSEPSTRDIPVIFLSALDETLDKIKAFQVGGVDYVSKPFQLEELMARIQSQLKLRTAQAQILQLNTELEERVRQRTAQLEKEIIERQRAQEKLLHFALHDTLTGLPNRAWFMRRLSHILDNTRQSDKFQFAVLLLDCDRFRVINDSLGHPVGDQLLVAVARRLESCLRPSNTLARLGGDEFIILLDTIDTVTDATRVADLVYRELALPFQLDEHEIYINASIGIVIGGKSYEDAEHLLRDADSAMYQAKGRGKACYQVFEPEMHHRNLTELQLENDIRRAIERQEFLAFYQPIVGLSSGKIEGFEALVRWKHPSRGLIPPAVFIPIAEETGLINAIDLAVLRQACAQLFIWQEKNYLTPEFKVSVNLSTKQFSSAQFLQEVDTVLHNSRCDRQHLTMEITESTLVENAENAIFILEQLRSRQIRISIDDFGTGYSSLSYLHRFPVDTLKIDRSFVSGSGANIQNTEIVGAIIALADNLGIATVAEGVETSQQLAQLRELGCEFGQGYYFSKPIDSQAAQHLLLALPQW